MPKRNGEGGDDDGEVIDFNKTEDKGGNEEGRDRGTREEPAPVTHTAPEIEPREAILERTDHPEAREERDDREDPREPRRRGEEPEDYSRRVQGRINREVALRRRTENRLNEQIVANDELRERLVKIERRQSAGEIEGDAKKKIAELQVKIDAVTAKLKAAKDAGDTALDLQFTIELTDLQADKKLIERRSEHQAAEARRAAEAGTDGAEEARTPAQQRIDRMTSKWQTANRKWWNLNRFQDVRQDAIELDKELRREVKDGLLDLEEYSDEYFAELSIRLKENYPDLDVRGLDGEAIEAEPEDLDRDARHRDDDRRDRDDRRDDRRRDRDPPRRTSRHPGGNMGTRDGRRNGSDALTMAQQGRVRLTEADYAQMRVYGLNPNDPAQKRAFAKERMRTILTDENGNRRGGGR